MMQNRNISVLGDSISTFGNMVPSENSCYYFPDTASSTGVACAQDTWWMKAIGALGGNFLANGSFSSSLVEGAGFPAASSRERALQVLGADGAIPDDILVFIGINDYGWGGADAQAKGRSSFKPLCLDLDSIPQEEPGLADAHALDAFAKAYIQMLSNLKSIAPHARIWCMTLIPGRMAGHTESTFCYSLRGVDIDAYNDAIRHAAKSAGCNVADIRAYGLDYQSIDGTHPDAAGMDQLAALAVAAIERRPLTADETALFPESLQSDRLCFRPNCIGCEYAESTDSKWSCVCELGMGSGCRAR